MVARHLRRHNAKGRSKGAGQFVMLENWVFDCEAYRTLKCGPRALLWEMIRLYNGTNNGRIGFSQRNMALAINVTDRETVAGYVRDLEARGLIIARHRGGFNVKVADRRASEWALTMLPIGEALATKDFVRWTASKIDGTEKPALQDGKAVLANRESVRPRSNLRDYPSVLSGAPANLRAENPSTYISLAIGSVESGAFHG